MEAQVVMTERTVKRRQLDEQDLRRLRVGQRYWGASLALIPDDLPYKKTLLNYAQGIDSMRAAGIGLLLYGDNGSGKTSAAIALLKEARRRGFTGLFLTAIELRELFYKDQEFEAGTSMLRRAQVVDFLIVDDVGKDAQAHSDHAARVFEDIVRRRSNELKPTLITANMKPVEMVKIYHRSFMELLTGCVVHVEVQGANWRLGESVLLKKALGI